MWQYAEVQQCICEEGEEHGRGLEPPTGLQGVAGAQRPTRGPLGAGEQEQQAYLFAYAPFHIFWTHPIHLFFIIFPLRLFWLQDRFEHNNRDLTNKRTAYRCLPSISEPGSSLGFSTESLRNDLPGETKT